MEQYTFLSQKPPTLGAATCRATSMQLLSESPAHVQLASALSGGEKKPERAPFGIPGQRIKDDFCFQPKTRGNSTA